MGSGPSGSAGPRPSTAGLMVLSPAGKQTEMADVLFLLCKPFLILWPRRFSFRGRRSRSLPVTVQSRIQRVCYYHQNVYVFSERYPWLPFRREQRAAHMLTAGGVPARLSLGCSTTASTASISLLRPAICGKSAIVNHP